VLKGVVVDGDLEVGRMGGEESWRETQGDRLRWSGNHINNIIVGGYLQGSSKNNNQMNDQMIYNLSMF
jgi:hypothetical protein